MRVPVAFLRIGIQALEKSSTILRSIALWQQPRLVDAILNDADATSINGELNELEVERSRLASELALSSNDEPLLHPNVATIYRIRVEARSDLLRSDADREAIALLRSIIEEVRAIPRDDGAYRLEVRGSLAVSLRYRRGPRVRRIFGCAEGAENQVGGGGAFCVLRKEIRRIRAFRPVIRST